MPNYGTGTIYTTPADSWETISAAAGLSRDELKALNPHLDDVVVLQPGIPIDIPYARRQAVVAANVAPASAAPASVSPYSVAQKELLKNIAQISGEHDNHEQIVLYHSTTGGGAMPDEVAWCSSFVNYCVEQSGLVGTDSKAARSWKSWGTPVAQNNWREGDIVVFWRESPGSWKGHVGFLVSWNGSSRKCWAEIKATSFQSRDPIPSARSYRCGVPRRVA
jgi:uncharacterized protein (TIGR02594 family)